MASSAVPDGDATAASGNRAARLRASVDWRVGDATKPETARDVLREGGYVGVVHAVGMLLASDLNALASGSGSIPDADATYDTVTRVTACHAADAAVQGVAGVQAEARAQADTRVQAEAQAHAEAPAHSTHGVVQIECLARCSLRTLKTKVWKPSVVIIKGHRELLVFRNSSDWAQSVSYTHLTLPTKA